MTKCKPIMLCMFFLKSKGLVDCVHNFLTKSLRCTYPPNEGTQTTNHGYGRKIKACTKTPLHFHYKQGGLCQYFDVE
jgi:hypothetical protein